METPPTPLLEKKKTRGKTDPHWRAAKLKAELSLETSGHDLKLSPRDKEIATGAMALLDPSNPPSSQTKWRIMRDLSTSPEAQEAVGEMLDQKGLSFGSYLDVIIAGIKAEKNFYTHGEAIPSPDWYARDKWAARLDKMFGVGQRTTHVAVSAKTVYHSYLRGKDEVFDISPPSDPQALSQMNAFRRGLGVEDKK